MDRQELMHFLLDVFEYKRLYQARSSGLRPVDLFLLERIEKHDGCQTLDLSRMYQFAPATLISMLDRLEADNLVERRRSSEDRRIVHIHLKDKGRKLLENHKLEDEAFVANLFRTLNETEQKQLVHILSKLSKIAVDETLFQPANN